MTFTLCSAPHIHTTLWSGYDELDTRLRAKGVQDAPKKKAIRQAVQGLSGKGGPVRGMTAKDLSGEPGIKDSTLRRWACEYEEMGDDAFPGNGSPKINKDYERRLPVSLRRRHIPEAKLGRLL